MSQIPINQARKSSFAELLQPAMQAYLRGDTALGRSELATAARLNSDLRNPHLLMKTVRSYAHGLLHDSTSAAQPAVQFMRAFLTNLPDEVSTLRPFVSGELSDWLMTAAYHEYGRGELRLTRSYVSQAIGITPQLLADRGAVSLLLQSLLGKRAIKTGRIGQPKGLAKRATLDNRFRLITDYLRTHDIVKLHVGCGDNLLDGWLNTDLSELNGAGVVYLDATQPLPFEDETIDFVFSEHMIEHIGYHQGTSFLKECHRVLKPGGVCRVATPTFAFLNAIYNDRSGKYAAYLQWSIDRWVGGPITTPAIVINDFVRNWGHQFIYDFDTLARVFELAGFVEIVQREVGQSGCPELQNLERHGDHIPEEFNLIESMAAEARKAPGAS